jgi:hypothetical protein
MATKTRKKIEVQKDTPPEGETLLNATVSFLDDIEFWHEAPHVEEKSDNGDTWFHIDSSIKLDNSRYAIWIEGEESRRGLIFYTVSPLKVPVKRRAAVSELLTRMNYTLFWACLEMDFSDGELRSRTTVNCKGRMPTPESLQSMLYSAITAMDSNQPWIEAVVIGEATPEEAYEKMREA